MGAQPPPRANAAVRETGPRKWPRVYTEWRLIVAVKGAHETMGVRASGNTVVKTRNPQRVVRLGWWCKWRGTIWACERIPPPFLSRRGSRGDSVCATQVAWATQEHVNGCIQNRGGGGECMASHCEHVKAHIPPKPYCIHAALSNGPCVTWARFRHVPNRGGLQRLVRGTARNGLGRTGARQCGRVHG